MARQVELPEGFEREDFKKEARRAKTAKGRIRCLGMGMLQKGKSVSGVAEALGQSRQTVHAWLKWYRNGGIRRLIEPVRGRGKKSYLEAIDPEQIIRVLEKLQEKREGGRCTWRDFTKEIEKRWSKKYGRTGIYALLNRLKMSWVTARSKHPKMNAKEQETFKKTSGEKSKKSSLKKSNFKILKSGSKTNTELANKEA